METIVIFNMGRDAKRDGLPCEAPSEVDYPVRNKWEDRVERATLSIHMQREWVRGWHRG